MPSAPTDPGGLVIETPPGKEQSRHFSRKVDANAWLDAVTASVQTGSYVDPKSGRITVGEWAPRWLATKVNLKLTTLATYENPLRNHVLPTWGTTPLSSITHESVAAWVAALSSGGLSASTVRQTHRVFALVLGLAVRDGRLARNPAIGVPLPRAVRGEQVHLTYGEVDDLAAAAGEYRLVILFLAYTGVRFGEMAALRIRHLDLLRPPGSDRRGRGRGPRQSGVQFAEGVTRAARCQSPVS